MSVVAAVELVFRYPTLRACARVGISGQGRRVLHAGAALREATAMAAQQGVCKTTRHARRARARTIATITAPLPPPPHARVFAATSGPAGPATRARRSLLVVDAAVVLLI